MSKAELLAKKCALQAPDFIELSAVGATLHSYYNGLENIFVFIGKRIDNATFSSQRWHKDLLDSMFTETDKRKALLDESIHEQLLDYMSFRHVFRHSYGELFYKVRLCLLIRPQNHFPLPFEECALFFTLVAFYIAQNPEHWLRATSAHP